MKIIEFETGDKTIEVAPESFLNIGANQLINDSHHDWDLMRRLVKNLYEKRNNIASAYGFPVYETPR